MASSDDILEGSVLSVITDSFKSNPDQEALSPDEISWLDSCLVENPELSESGWNSMKDALMEILGLHPESQSSLPSRTEPGMDKFSGRNSDGDGDVDVGDYILINSETVEIGDTDNFPVAEETSILVSETSEEGVSENSVRNAFLPHYREDYSSWSMDKYEDAAAFKTEVSREDIFKVWDLGIPSEEDDDDDELVKQLNKALLESSVEPMPPISYYSAPLTDFKVESVDALIAGISNLSLDSHS